MDCFKGQPPHHGGIRYRLNPGASKKTTATQQEARVKIEQKLTGGNIKRVVDSLGKLMEVMK